MKRFSRTRATWSFCLSVFTLFAVGTSVCFASPTFAAQFSVALPERSTSLPILTIERRQYFDANAVAQLVSGELQVDAARGRSSLWVGGQALTLQVRSRTVRIGERAISLPFPPRLLGSRFLVPLDLLPVVLAERFDQEAVEWKPEQRVARVRLPEATITHIRVGAYPTYTRVVLETVGQQEWLIQKDERSDALRILLPGGVLAKGIRPFTFRAGIVRSVLPVQQAGGVDVKLFRHGQNGEIRTFTLQHPDRIVIDIFARQSGPSDQRAARQDPLPLDASSLAPQRVPPVNAGPSLAVMEASATVSRASADSPAMERSQITGQTPQSANGNAGTPMGGSGVLTVVLDPGHGGHDTGAIGPSGLMEKDVVLDLALRLRRLLAERLGIRVIMTRTEDIFVPLQERTAIANRAKADFFLSLHVNAAPKRRAVGFETFYFTREPSDSDARASAQRENLVIENNGAAGAGLESLLKITLADMAVTRDMQESGELAELVLTSLDNLLQVENRGVKSGPFYVLASAAMPAILVESAFITNPREERRLTQGAYRQRLAEALYMGIAKYKVRYERRVGMGNSSAAAAGS